MACLDITNARGLGSAVILGVNKMQGLISLDGIAASHAREIEGIVAGIHGVDGCALWTSTMRATVRKDDPPEDETE
jgi:hypothetical protein